jgi:hypothetical protein
MAPAGSRDPKWSENRRVQGLILNAPTYYSSGLAIQAMGIPIHRHWATLLDSLVATCLVIYVIFVSDFLSSLNNFLSFLVVWAGPYAGVWVADGLKRRWRYDASAIHDMSRQQGVYWYRNGVNPIGWSSLLFGYDRRGADDALSCLRRTDCAIAWRRRHLVDRRVFRQPDRLWIDGARPRVIC